MPATPALPAIARVVEFLVYFYGGAITHPGPWNRSPAMPAVLVPPLGGCFPSMSAMVPRSASGAGGVLVVGRRGSRVG